MNSKFMPVHLQILQLTKLIIVLTKMSRSVRSFMMVYNHPFYLDIFTGVLFRL